MIYTPFYHLKIILKMRLQRLESETADQYVRYNILYRSRNVIKMSTIISVSESGKTIYIEDPELNNALQTVTRKIYLIIHDQS